MRYIVYLLSSIAISLLFSAITLASEVNFETKPSVISPLASQSLLLDIVNVEQSVLVAVGEHGHIVLSSDAKSWQQAQVPVQTTLTSVYFFNRKLGWAVGHDATILHTKDAGLTWEIQQHKPQLEKPLLDVVFKTAKEGIAIGAYGMFFRTVDGGKTWLNEFHEEFLLLDDIESLAKLKQEDEEAYLDKVSAILPNFNRVVMDGITMYMVGETGLIAKSNDFGRHWQILGEIYQGSFFDIERTRKGNLIVVGLRGHVYRSLRNGTPWQQRQTNSTTLLNDIVLANDHRIFLLGNNGVVLDSADDGLTFELIIQKNGNALIAGVWFKKQLIVVSDAGVKIISL